MKTSLKAGFAQIFSCCPKNLSCPKFGGAAAPLAPPARTPMLRVQFCRLLQNLQLEYLQISSMLISGGNFINNNFTLLCIGARCPYKFSKD